MSARLLAERVLAGKSTGTNSLAAYTLANATTLGGSPTLDSNSDEPVKVVFAVVESNRAGVAVTALPGGTQDLLVTTGRNEVKRIQLRKPSEQIAALRELGISTPRALSIDAMDLYTVEALLSRRFKVELETPLQAAVRETEEEHGLQVSASLLSTRLPEFRARLISKRSLSNAEFDGFTLAGVETIDDLADVAARLRAGTQGAEQVTYAVEVPTFEDVPVERRGRIESGKIPGRKGQPYYEEGKFMTVKEVAASLQKAIAGEKLEALAGNDLAWTDIVAAFERLQLLAGVEAYVVRDLVNRGVPVEPTSPITVNALEPVMARTHIGGGSRRFQRFIGMREEAKQALSAASPGAIMLDLLNFSETCGVGEKLTRTPLEDLMHPPRDSNVPLGQAGLAIAVRVARLKQWAEVGPASLFRDGPRRVDPSAAEIRIFLAADDDLALAAHCVQTDVLHASPTDLAAMDIRELAKLGQGSKEASEVLELRRALLVEFAVTNYDSPAVARIGPLADGNPDDEAVVQLDALCRSLADHFGDQCAQIEKAFSEEFTRLNRAPHFFSQPPGIGLN